MIQEELNLELESEEKPDNVYDDDHSILNDGWH
jgi:hypothetical protein